MNCEESKNLITISVFGELIPSEKARLEAHLQECPECAGLFEESGKLSELIQKKEDIPLPDKEKSWQIIAAKTVKRKSVWLERLVPKKLAFQYSAVLLLLIVGFAAGYFIHSGWQRGGEIAQLRQEVIQIREITAASLIRQESLNTRLREAGLGSPLAQTDEGPLRFLYRTLQGESGMPLDQAPAEDPYFIQSLSEQTSPLVEIALALARHLDRPRLY
jgi:Zn-finger nucleic acid-binding protein